MAGKKNETTKTDVVNTDTIVSEDDGTKSIANSETDSVEVDDILEKAKSVGILNPERYPTEVLENEIRAREPVTVQLPKDHMQYKYDLKITNPITKELMIIKRGVPVEVPRCVKDIIDQATEQAEFAYQQQEKFAQQYADEARTFDNK